MANPLRTLQEYGQSVWLDFVSRDLLQSGEVGRLIAGGGPRGGPSTPPYFVSRALWQSGELGRLIAEDGLRGVTSNPSIFEKAIGHGNDYDELIAAAEAPRALDRGA